MYIYMCTCTCMCMCMCLCLFNLMHVEGYSITNNVCGTSYIHVYRCTCKCKHVAYWVSSQRENINSHVIHTCTYIVHVVFQLQHCSHCSLLWAKCGVATRTRWCSWACWVTSSPASPPSPRSPNSQALLTSTHRVFPQWCYEIIYTLIHVHMYTCRSTVHFSSYGIIESDQCMIVTPSHSPTNDQNASAVCEGDELHPVLESATVLTDEQRRAEVSRSWILSDCFVSSHTCACTGVCICVHVYSVYVGCVLYTLLPQVGPEGQVDPDKHRNVEFLFSQFTKDFDKLPLEFNVPTNKVYIILSCHTLIYSIHVGVHVYMELCMYMYL